MNCKTYEYKKVDNHSLKLDVYETNVLFSYGKRSKIIVYIHGGGLILGSRKDVSTDKISLYNDAGYTFVSIDYRLAPLTKLRDIIYDAYDAITWVQNNLFKYCSVDVDNIAVIGSSAGGYLALMSGLIEKKPKVIVSFYGYGDIIADWAIKASSFYLKDILITKEQAESFISNEVVSNSSDERFLYYLYCRQSGNWISEISGYNTLMQKARLKKLSPFYNLDENFPKTLLIHGDKDNDVPFEESLKMAIRLNESGVFNELIRLNGEGHEFDKDMNKSSVINTYESVLNFLEKKLK
ncbi:MAG: alpha/beta hydrolase [Acidaminobacteraceae bacterium]